LLGFSISLAARLGFINLPFINGTSAPTAGVVEVRVPNLIRKSYQDAQTAASGLGFNLHSENGTDGVVIYQNPTDTETAPKGATIDVKMGPKTAKIPPIPQGATLASYEALLRRYGFTNFTTKPDGVDLNIPPNAISRVNPTPGTAYDVTKVVTIYVKNDTLVTPAASPTP